MNTAAEAFVKKVITIFETEDYARLDEIIGDSITFYTPRFLKPHTDRLMVILILQGIPRVIDNFHYERSWATGGDAIMEFKGKVGRWDVHGIDVFSLGEDGRAKELTVFVRPPKGLEALGEREDKMFSDALSSGETQAFS